MQACIAALQQKKNESFTFDSIPQGVGLLQIAGLDLVYLQTGHQSHDSSGHGAVNQTGHAAQSSGRPLSELAMHCPGCKFCCWPACFSIAHRFSCSRARFCSASATCCSSTGVLSSFFSETCTFGVVGPAFAVLFLLLPISICAGKELKGQTAIGETCYDHANVKVLLHGRLSKGAQPIAHQRCALTS